MLKRASPDRKSRRVTGILKALLTDPGLDQRAIHREVLVGKIPLGLLQHALEEFLRHLLVQQPIPALVQPCAVYATRARPKTPKLLCHAGSQADSVLPAPSEWQFPHLHLPVLAFPVGWPP